MSSFLSFPKFFVLGFRGLRLVNFSGEGGNVQRKVALPGSHGNSVETIFVYFLCIWSFLWELGVSRFFLVVL